MAVHNAGALAVQGCQLRKVVQQPVDQGAVRTTGGRMHGEPRRFFQHQQRVVLIDDVQPALFGQSRRSGTQERPAPGLRRRATCRRACASPGRPRWPARP